VEGKREQTMVRRDQNPYLLLGVSRQASRPEITRAYRRAARETHPDNRPGDPSAATRFSALSDAYDTLRDPDRRAAYDRAHPNITEVQPYASRPAPPLVHPVPPRPATPTFSALTERRRPPLWAGPVHITGPAHQRLMPTTSGDAIFELAAALSPSLFARYRR